MKPRRLDLDLTRGDDAQIHFMFRDNLGPFDLAPWTISGEVRAEADPALAPLASFTPVPGPSVGEITLRLEEETTEDLPPRCFWSFRAVHPPTDFVQTWLAGAVRVDVRSGESAPFNDYSVLIGPDEVTVLAAANVGPVGPPGEPGLQGVAGQSAYELAVAGGFTGTEAEWLASLGASSYVHDQASAAAVWTINHGLGIYPSVTTVTSAGDVVEGDVTYVDISTVSVSFSAALGGFAYLS